MGCFPEDFREGKRPIKAFGKRPIKVGKRLIKKGKRPIKVNGLFSGTPPCRKTAPPKRPIKRSMNVREPLHVGFALSDRGSVKTDMFEKRVFEQTTPLKRTKRGGHFPWTTFGYPQTCVYPDVCLGIAHVSGKAPLPGQGKREIHNVSALSPYTFLGAKRADTLYLPFSLVLGEGLYQIHGQSLNTHRGKHRSGGTQNLWLVLRSLHMAGHALEHQRGVTRVALWNENATLTAGSAEKSKTISHKIFVHNFCATKPPPSQPAKWGISSWISIKRTSNRTANTQPKLPTNPPKIANKQNYEQTWQFLAPI